MVSTYAGINIGRCLSPIRATSTATATGVAVDTWGYADNLIVVNVGVTATTLDGSNYWTFTFEECDVTTAGSFTHIADTDLEGGVHTVVIDDNTEDDQVFVRRYRGTKRYVRVVGSITGTLTNGTPMDVIVVQSHVLHVPVTQPTLVQA